MIDYRSNYTLKNFVRIYLYRIPLFISTFILNFFGFFHFLWNLIPRFKYDSKIERLIILGFGGIGNHILLTPSIESLKKILPNMNIHLVVSSTVCADIMENNPYIDSTSVINIGEISNLVQFIRAGLAIKKFEPDAVLAAAGTNPVGGSIISFFSGAHIRIGEDWKGRGFLYTKKLESNQKISELDQNLLISKLLKKNAKKSFPKLYLTSDEINRARKWLNSNGITTSFPLLGIHPGSGKQQSWKRWELNKFLMVAEKLSEAGNIKSILFFGPEELELAKIAKNKLGDSATIIRGENSIRTTAALIKYCTAFLSNDSGLRHIAVALGVSTIGIFGPTSIIKNSVNLVNHQIIKTKKVHCSPCHYTKWWLSCGDSKPCLNLISPDEVTQRICDVLKNKKSIVN